MKFIANLLHISIIHIKKKKFKKITNVKLEFRFWTWLLSFVIFVINYTRWILEDL